MRLNMHNAALSSVVLYFAKYLFHILSVDCRHEILLYYIHLNHYFMNYENTKISHVITSLVESGAVIFKIYLRFFMQSYTNKTKLLMVIIRMKKDEFIFFNS